MLEIDVADKKCSFRYAFNQGEHKSESYYVYAMVCQNPLCICNLVHMNFNPVDETEPVTGQEITYQVSLNVATKSIAPETKGTINRNFANSLITDFSDQDWHDLYRYYYSQKVFSTEASDLLNLDVTFPIEEIETDTILVSYKEIIPYPRSVTLTINDSKFIVEDLYCVRPKCQCNDVHLFFIPFEKYETMGISDKGDTQLAGYIVLNLRSGKWQIQEEKAIRSKILMNALFQKYDPIEIYAQRYKSLRILYKKYRNMIFQEGSSTTFEKIGRNDLCPCGSGKKYKKCCLLKSGKTSTRTQL